MAGTLALGGAVVATSTPIVPAPEAAAAPFECPAEGFLVQNTVPDFYAVDIATGESEQIADNIFPTGINSIGYNVLDDFVYGVSSADDVIRIHDDGATENLGPLDDSVTFPVNTNMGDVTPQGLWYIRNSTVDRTPWAAVDLRPGSPTYLQIVDSGTTDVQQGTAPGSLGGADWAYSPLDGMFYSVGYGAGSGQAILHRFDPATGVSTAAAALGVLTAPDGSLTQPPGQTGNYRAFGAVYADADGFLYGSGNGSGHIWRVDLNDPSAATTEFFAFGPASTANDGARCAAAPLPVDFGDAPASYGTSLADDGARHSLVDYDPATHTAPLMLGDANTVDDEIDGVASATADSDDAAGVDDEGAVIAPVTVTAGQETSVPVTVTNDSAEPATLAAWLDADHSGTYDAGELVTTSVPASSGTDTYSVMLPAATTGETFLRLRLFAGDVADPSPTGAAAGGEVEDHPVVAQVTAGPPFVCTGDAYLFQDVPSESWVGDLVTGEFTQEATGFYDSHINGIGYNLLDGYVYGWSNSASPGGTSEPAGLVRIGADYDVENLGLPEGTSASTLFGAGDVDGDGVYWGANPSAGQGTAWSWAAIDVDPDSPTYAQTLDTGTLPQPTGLSLDNDWAVNPVDGLLYQVATVVGGTARHLVRVDYDGAELTATDLGLLSGITGETNLFGAVYFDADGNLYAGNNTSGAIYRIDTAAVTASFFAQGPGGVGQNDGARCATAPIVVDFGDAPDTYATTLDADGARHGLVDYDESTNTAPLMLGDSATVDSEDDGMPGAGADGDDTAGVDDEGAVADPITLTTGVEATVTVAATNTTDDAATLAGWVDLDGNGTFEADELVTVEVPAGSGTADYELTFPGATVPGDSYARFRLFAGAVADPSPTGPVSAGEVEDYPVTVQSEPLTCETVYSIQSNSPWNLYEVNTSTGVMTPVHQFAPTGGINALGISGDGQYAFSHSGTDVFVFDTATETTATFGTGQSVAATHGAVDRATGVYYYGNISGSTAQVYAFDPATSTDLGHVASISIPGAPGANGDWAFDSFGNLYLSAGAGGSNNVYVASGPLPSTEQPSPVAVAGQQIATIAADDSINGLAVDVAGYMYVSSANTLYQVNPSSGQVVASPSLSPSGLSVDLASCATPATIEVMKDVVDRRDPTDQFTVSITGGGIVDGLGNTGTTTGEDLGLQDEAGEFGGPLMALVGETYTVTETPAGTTDLTNYTTTWQCVNQIDDSVIAEGEGIEGEFTMPPATAGGVGAAVLCTFTNEDLPQPGLTITKTADPADEALPGGTVEYTVTVENSGETDYTAEDPATFTDDLTEVLDDAAFNDDASADVGTPSYTAPELSWSGPLAVGETATITYSVTVDDPPSGDGELTNAVVGPPESNCVDGTEEDCTIVVPVRALAITKTVVPADEALPGDTVDYTVTVENIGQAPYTVQDPATFTDDLTEVLDDATFDDDASADVGEVNYDEPQLTWEGALAPGDVATVTYSVTVNDPLTGDGTLTNAVVGPPESNCDDGTETDCTTDVPVRALEITKTADPDGEVLPGGTVTYTVTVENTGQVPYTALDPATFDDDLTDVLDDATWNSDATADIGAVAFADPTLSWSGPLPAGETATITYSVTVNDPLTGDGTLTNAVVGPPESGCDDGTEPGCSTDVPVRDLIITKTADPADEALPGDTVDYTVTVTNSGQAPYTALNPATFDDDLTDVLDDATFNDDATADVGEATYAEPTLSWSGALAPGDTATITYSVTVNDPVSGDGTLTNAVVGPPESGCVDGTEPGCGTDVPVRALTIVKSSDGAGEALPGDTVTYTITVENSGQVPYTPDGPATFDDDLTEVLDDATFGEVTADVGEAAFADPTLSWSGPLEPGETATITYTVTVNDPPSGDGEMLNVVVGPPESNCTDPGATDPDCIEPNPVRALEIAKSADPADEVLPGETVTYTVTVENTGQVAYTADGPATFDDDLSGVLDDAVYNGDATADLGATSYAEPELTWSGALEPGETATITYSVTVNDPPSGDGTLDNAVVGPPESNCDDGSEDGCHVPVPVRALEITKTADPADEVTPGSAVEYTITVTNTGGADYTDADPASFTDDLSEVLDDATYDGDAAADAGEVTYAEPTLSWSGALASGATATITYSMTVNDPPTGDGVLDNAVVGPEESNCDDGSEDGCHVPVPVKALEITKTADPSGEVLPGGTVEYTVTVTNTGGADYTADDPASFTDDLTNVLDDASWDGDATADVGAVSFADPILSWSGPLPAGETATIAYSVTVNDPVSGDGTLENAVVGPPESNCDDGSEDGCHVPVPVRALEISKTADPSGEVLPGGTVEYTVTVTNAGQVAYTALNPATFTDDLTEVLDDATYNDDASADAGEVTYAEPELAWEGALPAGESATITYSVTVNDPLTGDGTLENAVVGPPESNCDDGSEDGCHVPVPVRALEISKTADPSGEVLPGGTVAYTVTVENTGQVAYTALSPATFTDDLSAVLDDATWNGDAAADVGAVSFAEPILSWSGALPAGETATITYSVTVDDPPSGDGTLTNAVVGPDESNCEPGSDDAACGTDVPVRALEIVKTADPSGEVLPGGTVDYSVTVTNTGQVAYSDDAPATFTDDLSGVLDDATFDDDAAADVGTVTYAEPELAWEGALEPGDTATITYSVTVNDPLSGDGTLDNAVVGPPESSCDAGTEDGCHVPVPVRALLLEKTSDGAGEAQPGDVVTYTVTATNIGQVPYTEAAPATFTDDLTEVLDDATFDDDAAADVGEVTYAEPTLSWSGALAPGEVATVTYSVTVNDPPSGDGEMVNVVVGPPESNCTDPGSADPDCVEPDPIRDLTISKSADPVGQVDAGSTVTYTVTVENTGGVDYTADDPASFTDDLTEVLDDATFDDDATADVGEVAYAEPELAWSGALAVGETATITYSVTVNNPLTGDGTLTNVVVGPEESNCEDGAEDPECGADVPVRALHLEKTSDGAAGARPGDTITYTVTATNTGQVPYTDDDPATFDDDLTEVLDDAVFNDDAAADVGTASYAEPILTWSGPLEPGEVATITYSVTLDDPPSGDENLFNVVLGPDESNCTDPESDDPDCIEPDPVKGLEILKSADPEGAVTVGDTVTYTIQVTNTGTAPYTEDDPAFFTDDLSNVLDDAVFGDDAAADVGDVGYTEPELAWSGALEPGQTATITYSVTVNDPRSGDGTLANAVLGPQESNCPVEMPSGGGGAAAGGLSTALGVSTAIPQMPPGCQVLTPIRSFEVSKTSDTTEAAPGDVVTYTVTVTSTGTAPYTDEVPAGFSDDLSDVLDDAAPEGTPFASDGELSFTDPVLTWTGPLDVDGVVTVTYSVRVGDPDEGDGALVNVVTPTDGTGGRCTSDDECSTSTTVTPPTAPAGPGILPRTGPEWIGTLLAVALLLTLGGGLLHRYGTRREQ
ncbi:hypothetical protein GCM10009809_19820 [Isoptericola hypogeus]|uniref:Uncharacterized protein n=1 Tax=Isoptericola hypogeus TaxID=300179 RepID=A0ABN2JFN0_9MICO